LQAYPRLIADLQSEPENRGLVSFISDHLMSFTFLTNGDTHPNVGLDDEKPRRNLVQETSATPLLPRSVLQVHSPSEFQNYDVGSRIWGFDPNEGRLEGHHS
jgi:hypothetical protein